MQTSLDRAIKIRYPDFSIADSNDERHDELSGAAAASNADIEPILPTSNGWGNQPPKKRPSKRLDNESHPASSTVPLYHSVLHSSLVMLPLRCYQRDPARFLPIGRWRISPGNRSDRHQASSH